MQGAQKYIQFVQVKNLSSYGLGRDGSLELLHIWQLNDVGGERIPVPQSPWKEALSVAVGTGAESHESVFLLSCCANSWSDVVWDCYGYLMVDGFVEHG